MRESMSILSLTLRESMSILFNYYCTGILSFPHKPGKNEGSEIHSFPHIAGKYIIFLCETRRKVDKFPSRGRSPSDGNLLTFLSVSHKNIILF